MESKSTPQWMLDSQRRPRVVILGAPNRQRVETELQRLRPAIASHAEIVAEDLAFEYSFEEGKQDLVIVLGGDGSILQAARQMGRNQTPVLGINCGRLGFLADLSPNDFLETWPRLVEGAFEIVDHLMLRTSHIQEGRVVAEQLALNEAAVLGGPPYQITSEMEKPLTTVCPESNYRYESWLWMHQSRMEDDKKTTGSPSS